ncbi:excalibur calcium-binding domain-containing protein [Phenylobacterium soli]|uniref:excalibur calcium-binding domain-containing protein n=1 Tax=Phenylobacterium soli TaxID=2170551 RepID=UPI001D04A9E1|nr:excalibur calcium-binding domain-containing protein [Phenylobacterium soli]
MRSTLSAAAACLLFLAPGLALADPCKAIPDHGPLPAYLANGAHFSGRVVQVIDGDSLCVALGAPSEWVEVRLADFYAPELSEAAGPSGRSALSRVALGQVADCRAGSQSYDRVVAACRIGGTPIGRLLRTAGAPSGGRGLAAPRRSSASRSLSDAVAGAYQASARTLSGATAGGSAPRAFRSCAQARAAGAAPLYRGQPGYSPHLDGDHDGVACEPYRRR